MNEGAGVSAAALLNFYGPPGVRCIERLSLGVIAEPSVNLSVTLELMARLTKPLAILIGVGTAVRKRVDVVNLLGRRCSALFLASSAQGVKFQAASAITLTGAAALSRCRFNRAHSLSLTLTSN